MDPVAVPLRLDRGGSRKRVHQGRDMNPQQTRAVAEEGKISRGQSLRTSHLFQDDVGFDSARPLMVALLIYVMRDSEDESSQCGNRNESTGNLLNCVGQWPLCNRLDRALEKHDLELKIDEGCVDVPGGCDGHGRKRRK